MNKQFIINNLVWGTVIWLIGYLLSMILFFIVPPMTIGWIIMPIGIAITYYILHRRVMLTAFSDKLWLAINWTAIAIILDYLFIVKLLSPDNGYYKISVYMYYVLTFILPLVVSAKKKQNS